MPEASITERLAELANVFRDIKANPRAKEGTLADPSLYPSYEALKATLDFLDGYAEFRGNSRGTGPTKPLWDLLIALGDLEDGVTAPMLRHGDRKTRGEPTHYQVMKAWSAIYLDAMINSGIDPKTAASVIAKELKGVKLSNGATMRYATAETVIEWRSRLSRRKAAVEAQRVWDAYKQKVREPNASRDPQIWVAAVRDHFLKLVADPIFRISP